MAFPYNGYYPNGYSPYNYAFPQYQQQPIAQQPMMQQPQTPAQPVQTQPVAPSNPSSIIWVRNQQEAAMYPVAPNNAVALWDSSAPSIYLKQADASGKPSMKIYDLVERAETPQESANAKTDKVPAYATKEELGAVVGVVKGFDELIGSIKSDIDTMKGDIYGLAGKKKSKKEVEREDEE